MKIYNSVINSKVDFQPLKNDEVRIYVCGPTVYDNSHLGHARSAITFDLLRRLLEQLGKKVIFVKNFTDIDDKILRKMAETNSTLQEITNKYINSYLSDMSALKVLSPTISPKATETINEIIEFIQVLIKKGYAYKTSSGDIYFDTSKDEKYFSISKRKQDLENRESRLKEQEQEKKNPEDFVLWKSSKPNEAVKFKTEIGTGRPGWHIECSAMIEKHLAYKDFDYSIDIHGGGADLIFPHHENEASQSRCFSGRELAKYWMHNGFVRINGEKMSKSLGNSFFVKDALKIYSGELLRFYLLSTHYRQDFNFSEEELLNSKKRLDKLYRLKKRVFGGKPGKVDLEFKNDILEALKDDLNVSVALAKIDNFISKANDELDNKPTKNSKKVILANIDFIDEVLGFGGENPFAYLQFGVPEKLKTKIEQLIAERTKAKKNKDFKTADKIRDELKKLKVSIMDTPAGTVWEK